MWGLIGGVLKRPAAILVLAAIALGEAGVIYHLLTTAGLRVEACERSAELQQTQAEREQWQTLAETGAQQIGQMREERAAAQAAVRDLREQLAGQDHDTSEQIARIREAPPSDDGPVAPVLRDAIEALP